MSDPRLKRKVHPKLPGHDGPDENPFQNPWKMGAWDCYVKRKPDNPFDERENYSDWRKYDNGYASAWHDML